MSELQVSELAVYPVKSCAGITLESASVVRFGLDHDRRWMVTDGSNRFITQRQQARMCLIRVILVDKGVRLAAPGMPVQDVAVPSGTVKRTVTVWKEQCEAYDCGDAAAAWLSRFLGADCRLVYFPDPVSRQVDLAFAQPGDLTAFSDGFPILLVSQASLDDLNRRLVSPIPMARFRPNVVVRGCEPFAEDGWRRLRIGGLTYRVAKPCSRCIIPSIDFTTGERGREPIPTLMRFRKRDNKIYFGQNVIADGEGSIDVGMLVEVLE